MRNLKVFTLCLFVSLTCFASGKVSVMPQYFLKSQKTLPQIGISVYEPVVLGLAYNGWSGVGWQPRDNESSVMWFTSRHDLEKWYGDLGLSVGFTIRYAGKQDEALLNDQDIHLKIQYKLW